MSFRRFSRRLRDLLPPGSPPWVVAESVDSTNSVARRIFTRGRADATPVPGLVVVAHHQSRGRGRGAHVWESPAGNGVYASLLLPAVEPRQLASLPLLVAVGLEKAVRTLVPGRVALRWPNDLLVGGRKLGGVLIESMASPGQRAVAVAGFGVNHGPPGVVGATSILEEQGSEADDPERRAEDLAEIAWRLVSVVTGELERLDEPSYAARRYAAASAHRSGDSMRCRTPAGTVEGRFRGFDQRGFLRLETADGLRSLAAGELVAPGPASIEVDPNLTLAGPQLIDDRNR